MTDQELIQDFLALKGTLAEERRSELSYSFMHEVIRECERRNWTMTKLAEEVGVHRSQVTRWLSGSANVRLDTIARVEAALRVPLVEFNREHSDVFAEEGLPSRPPAATLWNSAVTHSIDYAHFEDERRDLGLSESRGSRE